MIQIKFGASGILPVPVQTPDMRATLFQKFPQGLSTIFSSYSPSTAFEWVPVPQYPDRPDIGLGELYWPIWGASRFACAFFCIDSKSWKDKALAIGNAVTVEYTNGIDGEDPSDYSMFVHSAIPIFQREVSTTPNLTWDEKTADYYLVSLVDARFYWTHPTAGLVTDSWSSLITGLLSEVGITPSTDSIPTPYGTPGSFLSLTGVDNVPVATALDGAASTVGMRIIVDPSGGVALSGPGSTTTLTDFWTDAQAFRISGGWPRTTDFLSSVPRYLHIAYIDTPIANEKSYVTGDRDRNDFSFPAFSGITSPAGLIGYGTLLIDSASVATGLFDQWASDYWTWNIAQFQATFAGSLLAPPSGYYDSVVLRHNCSDRVPTTTVYSNPVGSSNTQARPFLVGGGDNGVDLGFPNSVANVTDLGNISTYTIDQANGTLVSAGGTVDYTNLVANDVFYGLGTQKLILFKERISGINIPIPAQPAEPFYAGWIKGLGNQTLRPNFTFQSTILFQDDVYLGNSTSGTPVYLNLAREQTGESQAWARANYGATGPYTGNLPDWSGYATLGASGDSDSGFQYWGFGTSSDPSNPETSNIRFGRAYSANGAIAVPFLQLNGNNGFGGDTGFFMVGNTPGVYGNIGGNASSPLVFGRTEGGIVVDLGNGAVSGNGTVTSVNASTSIAGLAFSGGPVTTTGTLTLFLSDGNATDNAINGFVGGQTGTISLIGKTSITLVNGRVTNIS